MTGVGIRRKCVRTGLLRVVGITAAALFVTILSSMPGRCNGGLTVLGLPAGAVVTGCSSDFTRFCGYRVTAEYDKTINVVLGVPVGGRVVFEPRPKKIHVRETTSYLWDEKGRVLATLSGAEAGKSSFFTSGISADGTTVVGYYFRGAEPAVIYRWNAQTGMTTICEVAISSEPSLVVSRDGLVIAGSYNSRTGRKGFVWREGRGCTPIKPIDREHTDIGEMGISDDGRTILCRGSNYQQSSAKPGKFVVFRLNDQGKHFALPKPLKNGNFYGRDPFMISADGSTVAGPFTFGTPAAQSYEWCVWTTSGSMSRINYPRQCPPGLRPCPFNGRGNHITTYVISSDGRLIGAYGNAGYYPDHVIFYRKDPRGGYIYHDLRSDWKKRGYTLANRKLLEILRFSEDGTKVLCTASESKGERKVYLVGQI